MSSLQREDKSGSVEAIVRNLDTQPVPDASRVIKLGQDYKPPQNYSG